MLCPIIGNNGEATSVTKEMSLFIISHFVTRTGKSCPKNTSPNTSIHFLRRRSLVYQAAGVAHRSVLYIDGCATLDIPTCYKAGRKAFCSISDSICIDVWD